MRPRHALNGSSFRARASLAACLTALAAAAILLPPALVGTGWAQADLTRKLRDKETQRSSAPRYDIEQDRRLPHEIGLILEKTEEARQSGNYAVRYLRNIANTTYDWLLHLRISVVENDLQAINYDIQNCQLLYELIQESNPSSILLRDLQELSEVLAEAGSTSPSAMCLRLQLDVEKYGLLYPLVDLKGMASAIMRQHLEGEEHQLNLSLKIMEQSVALPNVDQPLAHSLASFNTALAHLDAGKQSLARQELKKAANLISLLNVSTFLCEGCWYLAKADDALRSGWFSIALASLKTADNRLESAEDRAWDEFSKKVIEVRNDLDQLISLAADRKGKTTLTPDRLEAVIKRIEQELQITY